MFNSIELIGLWFFFYWNAINCKTFSKTIEDRQHQQTALKLYVDLMTFKCFVYYVFKSCCLLDVAVVVVANRDLKRDV